jgi:hypothetical protein
MQLKDIPDKPILHFLYARKITGLRNCTWYSGYDNSIDVAMPPNTPEKLVIKKMAKLIGRGLVDGCPCGCRGDYEITQKGIDYISTP